MAETIAQDVRLERPEARVALLTVTGPPPSPGRFALIERLAARLVEAREGGAAVSVIASEVPGHWIGHASLRDLLDMFGGRPTSGDGAAWFRAVHELAGTDVVTIAAVSGDTAGGGAELCWACDLRVADPAARFAQPETQIGVITGLGGASRLVRLIGHAATAEIVLDGAQVSAQRLHALGAVQRIAPQGRATEVALAWAKRLATRPAAALAAQKRALREAAELPLSEALANEQRLFQQVARSAEALASMERVQQRYDEGALPDDIYQPPFEA